MTPWVEKRWMRWRGKLTDLPGSAWEEARHRDRRADEHHGPDSLDERAVTAAVKACYAAIGRPEPDVVWVDGPLSVLTAGGGQLEGPLRPVLEGLFRETEDELRHHVKGQLWEPLWDDLSRRRFRAVVRDSPWSTLWQGLASNAIDVRHPESRRTFDRCVSGPRTFDLWWLLENPPPGLVPVGDHLMDRARTIQAAFRCQLWLPVEGVVVMSRQHRQLHRDDRGRLHHPGGPAWTWADGTSVWALEGMAVPDWVITSPDPARFLSELPDRRQRWAALAAYGWQRAADELGWRVLDDSGDPYTGVLYRLPSRLATGPNGASFNLLVGRNGSPHPGGRWHWFGLPVARHLRTAVEAQASLWGITPEEWLAVGVRT